jgi:hypothetical protein
MEGIGRGTGRKGNWVGGRAAYHRQHVSSLLSLRLGAYSRISIGSDLIDYCICDRQFSLYSGLGLDLIALCEWRDGVPGSSDV